MLAAESVRGTGSEDYRFRAILQTWWILVPSKSSGMVSLVILRMSITSLAARLFRSAVPAEGGREERSGPRGDVGFRRGFGARAAARSSSSCRLNWNLRLF